MLRLDDSLLLSALLLITLCQLVVADPAQLARRFTLFAPWWQP